MTSALRVLLLCHSFNSLTQRLYVELRALGHTLSVELDIAERVTEDAIELFQPQLVIAPFLKRRIPESVWSRLPCLVVHPGPPGDRGPSALDWAVLDERADWGVTVLQANAEFDAGPIWDHDLVAMRPASKGSLYRREVAEAAVQAVLRAVARLAEGGAIAPVAAAATAQTWRPSMPQSARCISWQRDDTARVLAKLRSADGQPGVADNLFGHACHLSDGHAASAALLVTLPPGAPGELLARRDGALLRRTVDGAVWIGQARAASACGEGKPFKLPAALAFAAEAQRLPELPASLERPDDEWGELRYRESGPPGARLGCLSFDFHNGAMSTGQCEQLLAALREVKRRDTQVLMLLGGDDFFSNGIHLNCIEAAAYRTGDSAADESWRNINAMDDVALELIMTTDRLTVAVLRGNAGAGGAFLALAADEVWAHRGVVLNAHYKNMGNLYGSEYWTYLLPRRLGSDDARALMQRRLPLGATEAKRIGLIDRCVDAETGAKAADFESGAIANGLALALSHNLAQRIAAKHQARAADEACRPLAAYRQDELSRMHRNFYGFDPSYHVARYHFVHKLPQAWTPRHLAVHRERGTAA
ncbi:MAG TPA: enoyl-CoA hydratase-related protein [Ideonella sp.]|uniref:enoyl-CoA hydratase-related protein n=1 Tax=Ideonella sp. TaxID=1929293 RepID=UPI002C66BF22|nr:enoyl-CoA hydratase-related protein [Ideonella sp.]HSI49673.1 enoyl-CoA hydratase-related protein [Ideonella sp.]